MPVLPEKRRDESPIEDLPLCKLDDRPPVYYRVACWMGFHDFELLEVQLSFGAGAGVEKVKCHHCGIVMLRTNA